MSINISHLRYVLEVARYGSITKAADKIFLSQSNLSKAIKEIEKEYNVDIFRRTPKGVVLTDEGSEFISYARSVIEQTDNLEMRYKNTGHSDRMSVCVPRAKYISEAFSEFTKCDETCGCDIHYKETGTSIAVGNVSDGKYRFGIVRYSADYDKMFERLFIENGLNFECIYEFNYVLTMNKNCPLANLKNIRFSDLENYTELIYTDPYIPSHTLIEGYTNTFSNYGSGTIHIYERASMLDLIRENNMVFIWTSPLHQKNLDKFDTVQKRCADNDKIYKDVLIYRRGYRFSRLDELFLEKVKESIDLISRSDIY